MSDWTLFSNHGHVLVCLARNSEARLRDVALDVGITERAVQKIVRDLQDGGMISVTKNGRRNSYRIHGKKTLRHDLESACTLKDLMKFVNKGSSSEQSSRPDKSTSKMSLPLESGSHTEESISEQPLVEKKKSVQKPAADYAAVTPESDETGVDDSRRSESVERQQGFLF